MTYLQGDESKHLPSLSRITDDKMEVWHALEQHGHDDQELRDAFDRIDAEWIVKAEKCGHAILARKEQIALLDAAAKIAQAEVDRIKAMRDSMSSSLNRFEQYVIDSFLANEETFPPTDKKVNPIWRFPLFKMEVTGEKLSVECDNIDIVPDCYRREKVTFSADKQAIKADYEAGYVATVDGCTISKKRSLVVK